MSKGRMRIGAEAARNFLSTVYHYPHSGGMPGNIKIYVHLDGQRYIIADRCRTAGDGYIKAAQLYKQDCPDPEVGRWQDDGGR